MPKVKHMRIDFSGMNAWRNCPYYWQKYYAEGLRAPSDGVKTASDHGTDIHDYLQCYYSNTKKPTLDAPFDKLMKLYEERYPVDTEHFDVVSAEENLEVDVNDWLSLVMSIDLKAIDKYTKEPIIIDHKTTKWISFLSGKTHSLQFDTYMWGCQQKGFDVSNGLVNGICTHPDWVEKKKDKLFQRWTVHRSDFHLKRWKEQMVADCERIKYSIENELPMTQVLSDECHKYKRPCFLFSVCNASSKDLADSYLQGYTNDSWKNFSIEYA